MPFSSMILPRTLSAGHAWLSKRVGGVANLRAEVARNLSAAGPRFGTVGSRSSLRSLGNPIESGANNLTTGISASGRESSFVMAMCGFFEDSDFTQWNQARIS